MAKQSAPIQEVSRLLDLVPFLSTHSHISLKELAREFAITEKAMASELTALSMCGLPGYTPYELIEIYFESGFVTINNHEALDIPRALTQLEVASLLIGLEILRESAVNERSSLLEKIDSLISEMKSLLGNVIEISQSPVTSFQTLIESSIAHRHSLTLEYRSPLRDEVTLRNVDPLSIKSEGGHQYLVAFCHTASAIREFRLDRVINLKEIVDSTFSHHLLTSEEVKKKSVRLQATGDRRAIAEALTISEIGVNGEIEVEIFSSEWVAKAVLAHAPFLQVPSAKVLAAKDLEVEELRGEIKRAAENILALYSS